MRRTEAAIFGKPLTKRLQQPQRENMRDLPFKALCDDPTIVLALESSASSRSIGQTGNGHLAILYRAFQKNNQFELPIA
jgi:hypothetical protein